MNDVPPPPPSPYAAPPPGGGSPDVGAALSYGFSKFFANVGPVLAVVVIPIVAQFGLTLIGQFVVKGIVGYAVFQILGILISMVLYYAVYHVGLMITAGQPADIGKAFENDRWGEWFAFSLVYGLMVGIGIALCVIPGLVVIALFGLAPYYFIDQRMSVGEALAASRAATSSRGFALPVILCVVVGAAGAIACGIGLFVTAPAAYIAVAFLYRGATNQVPAP